MISTLEICDLVQALYDGKPFNLFTGEVCGVYLGIQRTDSGDVVVLRGSYNKMDWVRDFMALSVKPYDHSDLGPVHIGFWLGMEKVLEKVMQVTGPNRYIAGHSLGAGHAAILSGLLKSYGFPPVKRFQFGEPKPGFRQLFNYLLDVPTENYRNGDPGSFLKDSLVLEIVEAYAKGNKIPQEEEIRHDLVTDVPLYIAPLLEYEHSAPMIYVNAPPPANDAWGPFSYHHFPLYRQAINAQKN